MAGFTGLDDLINEMTTNSKTNWIDFQKTSANGGTSAAGRWHEFFTATGCPAAGSWSGSAGVATSLTSSTQGAMPLVEGNVSTDVRVLLNQMVWTNSSVITPATLILCDMLLYYPACVVTGTPTSFNNSVTLPRYTNGVGVKCFITVQSAIGAASPALTVTYTANDNSSQSATLTSPANSAVTTTCFANNGGVFLPQASTITGIKSLSSYTIASGTTGTVSMVLCKPLMQIPLCAQYQPSERDCLNQLASLPQIQDGACLAWLVQIGGAMTTTQTIGGRLQYAWG